MAGKAQKTDMKNSPPRSRRRGSKDAWRRRHRLRWWMRRQVYIAYPGGLQAPHCVCRLKRW